MLHDTCSCVNEQNRFTLKYAAHIFISDCNLLIALMHIWPRLYSDESVCELVKERNYINTLTQNCWSVFTPNWRISRYCEGAVSDFRSFANFSHSHPLSKTPPSKHISQSELIKTLRPFLRCENTVYPCNKSCISNTFKSKTGLKCKFKMFYSRPIYQYMWRRGWLIWWCV